MISQSINNVEKSYKILESLRLDNGLYLASSSSDYNFVWLRDSFYEVLPYLDKNDGVYEGTYHAILDILNDYCWKFDTCSIAKPYHAFEYIHPRYLSNGKKVMQSGAIVNTMLSEQSYLGLQKVKNMVKRLLEINKTEIQFKILYSI